MQCSHLYAFHIQYSLMTRAERGHAIFPQRKRSLEQEPNHSESLEGVLKAD